MVVVAGHPVCEMTEVALVLLVYYNKLDCLNLLLREEWGLGILWQTVLRVPGRRSVLVYESLCHIGIAVIGCVPGM